MTTAILLRLVALTLVLIAIATILAITGLYLAAYPPTS